MSVLLKQSTSVDVPIGPFVDSTDGVTAETALTITQPDVRLKKNAAAWAQKAAAQTLAHEENGYYEVTLDATDTDTLGRLRIAISESGALPVWQDFMVVAANVYDSLIGGGDTLDVQVTGIGANVITATSIAADAITDAKVAADVTIASVTGSVGSVTGAVGSVTGAVGSVTGAVGSVTAAVTVGTLAANTITASAIAVDAVTELRSIVSGTADSGTTTTMVDAALTEADTDYWKGACILFTSGTISGQSRLITGFVPATDTVSFAPATTQAVGTQTYEIMPAAAVDARLWNGTAPSDLIAGRVDASVGAIAAGAITAASIAADAITDAKVAADVTIASVTGAVGSVTGAVGSVTGAVGSVAGGGITAASFAADAITAAKIAADVTTELQAGLATAAALATVQADTDDIQSRLPAALVSGRMDSSVGAMAAGVLTATAIAADAITAAKLAADVTTEIQSGLATAAALATVQTDADDIQTRLPAALVGGRMDASVGAMAANVMTAAAAAADLTTELQGGLATAAALDVIDNFVDTEVASIKIVTDRLNAMIEAGAGSPSYDRFKVAALELAPTGGSAPSAATIADAVWDELLAGHAIGGSAGAALSAAGSAGDPWITALPGAYGVGTAGNIVGTNLDALITSRTKPADTQAAVTTVTNLTNAATAGDFTAVMKTSLNAATPASVAGAVGSVTGNVGGNVVGSVGSVAAGVTVTTNNDKSAYRLSATGVDDVWDEAIAGHLAAGSTGKALNDATSAGNPWNSVLEGSLTAGNLLRIMSGIAVGKTDIIDNGNGTATVTFRDASDLSIIVSAAMVGSERASVTLTP